MMGGKAVLVTGAGGFIGAALRHRRGSAPETAPKELAEIGR